MTTVRYIDTTGLPQGFDVGDLIANGTTGQDLINWCVARVRPGNVPPEDAPRAVEHKKASPAGESGEADGVSSGEKSDARKATTLPATVSSNVAVLPVRAIQPPPEPDESYLPPEYSDDSLARAFTHEHAGEYLYVPAWGRWMCWDGARWSADDRLTVEHAARMSLRSQADEIMRRQDEFKAKARTMATAVTSARAIKSVLTIARTHPSQSASPSQFDHESWLLNTPGGIVDLSTGQLRPATPRDYCTKVTRATPGGECPTWMKFLASVTGGDIELQQYLQRVMGYTLTGSTDEQALFFFYGTGQNGKGTFLNMMQWLVGDYTRVADMSTFTESKSERHTTELAELQGARMVTSQETDEGKRWAEARIKAMTGSDPITARFMRQDNFTYIPQFKLLIAGNHRPALRNIDPAMRRRMNLIPFEVTIPASQRDNNLTAKLRAEAGGIMAWAVAGCLEWQRIGLAPPDSVTLATDAYFASQDTVGQWLEDECIISAGSVSPLGTAYRSYQQYASRAGEYVMPQKRWLDTMELKGFRGTRTQDGQRGLGGFHLATGLDRIGRGGDGWL